MLPLQKFQQFKLYVHTVQNIIDYGVRNYINVPTIENSVWKIYFASLNINVEVFKFWYKNKSYNTLHHSANNINISTLLKNYVVNMEFCMWFIRGNQQTILEVVQHIYVYLSSLAFFSC